MKDTKDFNERFQRWKNGENYWEMRGVSLNTNSDRPATKEQVEQIKSRLAKFQDGKDDFEPFYQQKMKEVGEQNYKRWGFDTPQQATKYALIDPTYDYRGFYEKYPESSANSKTHWTDEFKTVHHPTFSTESRYSGNKNKFNPQGLRGGFWNGDDFVPATWQEPKILNKRRKIMGYADGKDVQYTRQNGNPVAFDEQGNLIDQVTGQTGVMQDEVFNRMAVTPQGVTFNGIVPNSSIERPKEQVYLNPTDYVNILTAGGLNNFSPTQWIRRAYDASTGNLTFDNWIYGNNGIVSDSFAENHPFLSTGINFATDLALYNPTSMYRLGKRINDSKLADRLRGYKYFEDVYHGSPIEFDIKNARTVSKGGYDTGLHVANNEDTPTFFGNRIIGGAKYKGRLRLKDRPIDVPDMGRWTPENFAYEAEHNSKFAEYLKRHGVDWEGLRGKYSGYINDNGIYLRGSSEQQMKDFAEMLKDKNIALRYINRAESSWDALPEYRSYYLSNPKQVKWSKVRVYGDGIPEQYKLVINPIDDIRTQWWKYADDPGSYYFDMNPEIDAKIIPPLHINADEQYTKGKDAYENIRIPKKKIAKRK